MLLNKDLLFAEEEFENYVLDGTSIKGSYNTMQFVLRLRDDIRKARFSDFAPERLQAQSTVIHENIHWWQHVGSNFGFLFSLTYPAFIHYSYESLTEIIKEKFLYKSLVKFDKDYYERCGRADLGNLNIVINNFYDLEYSKLFALSNENIRVISKDRRFFLNIGHSYNIFWTSTIHTLSNTIDINYEFLPSTNEWVEKFKILEANKIPGFYIDSPLHITKVGVKSIYEGQAIFNQAIFLKENLNKELTYDDFVNSGMFYGIYTKAFEYFLELTGYELTQNVTDPIVGLFLLVCDLSINPTNGFPLDIYDFEGFITKNDPGIRFTLISKFIGENSDHFKNKINEFSKDEYIIIAKELSIGIGSVCCYEAISTVLNWKNHPSIQELLTEEQEENYKEENLPIRLLFAKYFRFQEDKYLSPHIFCWIGFHLSSNSANFETANNLQKKHHAIFIDDEDGEIKATIFEEKPKDNLLNTFNKFYGINIIYDLVLKWVNEDGEFTFDYKWLAGDRASGFKQKIKENFKNQFGISIDDIAPI